VKLARRSPATLEERRWRVLAITGTGAFMGPLDVSAVAVALPALGEDLGLSFSGAIWVQAGYLLAYALVLVPAGRLGDAWGRLRIWRTGLVVFALASLMSGLAPDDSWLLAWRVVQGTGGAMLAATGTALVTAVFPPAERGRALGLNIGALYLGLSTGPLIGGVLVDGAGWRAIFLVNVPVAALALLGSLGLHEPRHEPGRLRLDLRGTLLLGVALTGVMVGFTFGPLWGWDSPRVTGLIVAGLAALAAFVVAERRARAPLVDLGMFRRSRIFALGNLASLLNYTAMFGAIALTAVLLQVVGGHTPTETGVLMIAQPLVMVALSPVAGHLSDRIGSRALASGGMVLVAAGLAILASVPSDVPDTAIVLGLAVTGLGMAMFSSPNTSAVMGAAERHRLGVAAAILAMMRTLGQTLSLAILGTLAAAPLGAAGARVLFGAEGGAEHAGAYLDGYRLAMGVGAVIALVGAALSSARGPVAAPATPAGVTSEGLREAGRAR
jgi:EmrB/QacA subfamily drug resistance transporter